MPEHFSWRGTGKTEGIWAKPECKLCIDTFDNVPSRVSKRLTKLSEKVEISTVNIRKDATDIYILLTNHDIVILK